MAATCSDYSHDGRDALLASSVLVHGVKSPDMMSTREDGVVLNDNSTNRRRNKRGKWKDSNYM